MARPARHQGINWLIDSQIRFGLGPLTDVHRAKGFVVRMSAVYRTEAGLERQSPGKDGAWLTPGYRRACYLEHAVTAPRIEELFGRRAV